MIIAARQGTGLTAGHIAELLHSEGPADETSTYRGRGVCRVVPIDTLDSLSAVNHPGPNLVVRRYYRGGIWQRIGGQAYFSLWPSTPPRPVSELWVAERAFQGGLPTPEPIAVALERRWGTFYHGWFLSSQIPRSEDLAVYLAKLPPVGQASPEELRQKWSVIRSAAQLISQMHRQGFCHGDLHLKNILLVPSTGMLYLIDWDKARQKPAPLSLADRSYNLLRLYRSVCKAQYRGQVKCLSRGDVLRFFRCYCEADEQWTVQWKTYWHQLRRLYQRHHWRWRLAHWAGL